MKYLWSGSLNRSRNHCLPEQSAKKLKSLHDNASLMFHKDDSIHLECLISVYHDHCIADQKKKESVSKKEDPTIQDSKTK